MILKVSSKKGKEVIHLEVRRTEYEKKIASEQK